MNHSKNEEMIDLKEQYFSSIYWKNKYKDLIHHALDKFLNQKHTIDPALENKIPKIRKIIFEDKDFIHLSNKIINYVPRSQSNYEDNKIKRVYHFKQFFNKNKYKSLTKSFTIEDIIILKNLVFSKSFNEYKLNLTRIIEEQFKKMFTSFIIMVTNEYTSLYLPYYYYNVDEETKKNFYINYDDEIFHFETSEIPNYEVLKITNELINNPYFSKRFSNNFIQNKKIIVYQYLKFGKMEFLLVYFFDDQKQYDEFYTKEIISKMSKIISFTYPLLRREDSIFFENKLKIINRMVFSYKFYLIKKILIKYKKIIKITIEFDNTIIDYYFINKNINFIKTFFQSHSKFILIRNHFFSISFFFEDVNTLEEEFWIIWNQFSRDLDLPYTITKEKYDIHSWSFLDL